MFQAIQQLAYDEDEDLLDERYSRTICRPTSMILDGVQREKVKYVDENRRIFDPHRWEKQRKQVQKFGELSLIITLSL